jgi:hypothetical protein
MTVVFSPLARSLYDNHTQAVVPSGEAMVLRLTAIHEDARSALECPSADGLDAALEGSQG